MPGQDDPARRALTSTNNRECCSRENHLLKGRILSLSPVVALAITPYELKYGLGYPQDRCSY
jgi:hypothetical protein